MEEKTVEKLDRVVVRFAGDSGDGMQLAGSRFTDATAVLGNDLATLPDFPAEIRAPAGTLHGVSAFQIHFASRDILTPGDHPNVLVAMNPAALKTNLDARRAGRHGDRQRGRASPTPTCARPATPSNPLDDDSARRLPGLPRADDARSRCARPRTSRASARATRRAPRTSSRSGSCLDVRPPDRRRPSTGSRRSSPTKPDGARRQPRRLPRRLQLRRDGGAAGGPLRGQAGAGARRAPTATSTARRRWRSAWSPPACAAACRSSTPATRSRPASELLHELSRHTRFGVRTMQAEDEIAAVNMALGAVVRRPARRHGDQRPGHGPEGGDDRPRGRARAAAGGDRRAARRPVDRHADQDRGSRPAAGDLRAPRRVAAAGDRRLHAAPTASTPRSRRSASRSGTARR